MVGTSKEESESEDKVDICAVMGECAGILSVWVTGVVGDSGGEGLRRGFVLTEGDSGDSGSGLATVGLGDDASAFLARLLVVSGDCTGIRERRGGSFVVILSLDDEVNPAIQ
jgi:hypothetical protein